MKDNIYYDYLNGGVMYEMSSELSSLYIQFMRKTIEIYIQEKELSYYLLQIQPIVVSYDTNAQCLVVNYNEWRELYVKTLPPIKLVKKITFSQNFGN